MFEEVETKEFKQFIEDLCQFNYEKIDGALYSFKVACDHLPYKDLPQIVKDKIREIVLNSLEHPDGIDSRLAREENEVFWDKSSDTLPSDEIVFETDNDMIKISTFWMGPNYASKGTPADLIFSKTIPITDMILQFKEFAIDDDNGNTIPATFRVFLYDNYKEIVDQVKSSKDCLAIVGGIIPFFKYPTKKNLKKKIRQVAYPICIGSNTEFIMGLNIAYKNCLREEVRQYSLYEIHQVCTIILNVFYGCQLALLNPIIEKVFVKARKNCIDERKIDNSKTNKKRKIMYVKKYYIREQDIVKSIEDYRTRNIRCPLWWVIGHYRKYQSGKTVWISGYWKGKDRNKVKHLNEDNSMQLRQRLLDLRNITE